MSRPGPEFGIGSRFDLARRRFIVGAAAMVATGCVGLAWAKDRGTPSIAELAVPSFDDANAIWGALGPDRDGRVWCGVSAKRPGGSAHLMRHDPASSAWVDAGAVNDQLARAGMRRTAEAQVKIHSRILQGPDGWLYFTSMDEAGEREDGSMLPSWGSHLWRIHPTTLAWEHLLAVPEGLVAAALGGPFVFTLGYFGHVLYRFDTRSGEVRRVIVGAEGGHACRNVLADARGHAFVPRLGRDATGRGLAHLLEFDVRFDLIGTTPLTRYPLPGAPEANHGIVGLAGMPDGRTFFTTHEGWLHELVPQRDGSTAVRMRGAFHPEGAAYAASLFVLDGGRTLAGVTKRGDAFDWVRLDLSTDRAEASRIDLGSRAEVLLYGSMTTDGAGRCYVAGWQAVAAGGHAPLLLRVDPS